MKITTTAAAVTAALLALTSAGYAATVEGFESTSLSSANSRGDASIRTPNYFGINPTEGTHALLLTSINNTNDSPAASQSGTNADTPANIASFLNVSSVGFLRNTRPGTLASDTGREGSAFSINLGALNVGDQITFDYNFLTSDAGNRDFGFYTLNGATANVPIFADELDAITVTPSSPPGNPFNLQSGWQTTTITISQAGNYTLGIGLMDSRGLTGPSAVMIDNIAVNAVPEPSTLGLILAGGVSLAAMRRRLRR